MLLGFAWALPLVFLSRVLDGLTGGNITVAQSYIADVTDEKDRAKGLGLIGAAFGLGFIAGPLFGGLLSQVSLSAPAFAAAGIAAFNLVLILVVLPESLTDERRVEMANNPRRRFSLKLLVEALRSPRMGLVLHTTLFYSFAFTMFQTIFSVFAQQRLGVEAATRGYLLAYVGVLVAIVKGGLIGMLTNRCRERRSAVRSAWQRRSRASTGSSLRRSPALCSRSLGRGLPELSVPRSCFGCSASSGARSYERGSLTPRIHA